MKELSDFEILLNEKKIVFFRYMYTMIFRVKAFNVVSHIQMCELASNPPFVALKLIYYAYI